MVSAGVGIDVGKRELVTCIRHSNGVTEAPATFTNSSVGLKKFVVHLMTHGVEKDVPIILESTGPYHWKAARYLTDEGFCTKVVNPLHTKQVARYSIRKRKTDSIDAAHLAFLAAQNYGYVFVETADMAKRKALVRHYWKLRAATTNVLLHERYLKRYRAVTTGMVGNHMLATCEKIKLRVEKEWNSGNDIKYLDSIPGVTPFLAATILAEIQPIDRFQRIEQIVAYAGLDPSVHQTGGKPGIHGRISKRGSKTLRRALYLAAFGAFNRAMRPLYDSYKARGLHHTEILCILSRKILRTAVALLQKRREFNPKYLTVLTPRK